MMEKLLFGHYTLCSSLSPSCIWPSSSSPLHRNKIASQCWNLCFDKLASTRVERKVRILHPNFSLKKIDPTLLLTAFSLWFFCTNSLCEVRHHRDMRVLRTWKHPVSVLILKLNSFAQLEHWLILSITYPLRFLIRCTAYLWAKNDFSGLYTPCNYTFPSDLSRTL